MEKGAGSHHSASVARVDAARARRHAGAMGSFAESIFGYLQRNSVAADRHFGIPGRQVIEVGLQLDL